MRTTQSVRCNELAEQDAPVQKDASEDTLADVLEAMLRRLARRFEANPAACTGLQQETLIALWLSTGGAEPRVSLQTWLYSVAEGVSVQHVIAGRVKKMLLSRPRENVDGGASLLPDPEGALASRARVTLLLTLLDSFRPREREAAFLDLQQFKLDRIAEKLRCSVSQVEQLLVIAQRRLQLCVRQGQILHDRTPVSLVRVSVK
jgi:RNA polymerase sigma factor (sigma-70 family)